MKCTLWDDSVVGVASVDAWLDVMTNLSLSIDAARVFPSAVDGARSIDARPPDLFATDAVEDDDEVVVGARLSDWCWRSRSAASFFFDSACRWRSCARISRSNWRASRASRSRYAYVMPCVRVRVCVCVLDCKRAVGQTFAKMPERTQTG